MGFSLQTLRNENNRADTHLSDVSYMIELKKEECLFLHESAHFRPFICLVSRVLRHYTVPYQRFIIQVKSVNLM